MQRWSSKGVVALIAIAGLYATGAQAAEPAPKAADAKLKRFAGAYPAPGFVDAAGKSHHLSEFKGKVVVMNLWATWCAPCKKEMPTLAALQKSFGKQPIAIVPVSVDSKAAADKAKAFMADNRPLPFFHDVEGVLTPSLKPSVEGYPTSFIYDRKGRLYGVIAGEANWAAPSTKAMLEKLAKS